MLNKIWWNVRKVLPLLRVTSHDILSGMARDIKRNGYGY